MADLTENIQAKEKKTKRLLWIPIIVLIILVGVCGFVVSARLFTGEDSWICSNGEWVKHGSPSAPKPTLECRKTKNSSSGDEAVPIESGNSAINSIKNINPVDAAHEAVGNLPDQNPVGPVQITGFLRWISPVVDIGADFSAKLCEWGRPRQYADNCPSIKANFQNFFEKISK